MLASSAQRPAAPNRVAQALGLGALAVAVYAALIVAADRHALARALGDVEAYAIAFALALIVAVYVVRSLRWRLYLAGLDVLWPRGPLRFGAAFAMGVPQGKWGQVVKAWALRQRARTPYERAIPAIFAERASELVGGLMHLAVGLALVGGDWRVALGAVAALGGMLLLMRARFAVAAIVRALRWLPWMRRHSATVLDGHARLRGHLTVRELAAPSTMALAAFLLESLALWAIAARGAGLDVSIPEAILMLALVDVAATVSLLPGGIGASEGSLLLLLTLDGAPLAEAAAVTLLFRACALWFAVALGGLGVAALHLDGRLARRRGTPLP